MEAICLDVTVQQVSPGWGGFKTSHPAKTKEKKIQRHRLNIRNVHHTRSLSQHTRHNKAVFTRFPARVHAALFALSVARREAAPQKKKILKQKENEEWGVGGWGWKEQPGPPRLLCCMIVFV